MRPSKRLTANNAAGNDPVFERPRISLLTEEHWLYIRKQYYMSPREIQVAKLVCQGFDNEEMASRLKIKQGTVKTHMRNIYRRIRVKNRIEMLLRFVDNAVKLSTMPEMNFLLPSNTKKDMPSAEVRQE